MCNRYTMAIDAEALAACFPAEMPTSLVSPSDNAVPLQSLPVILRAHLQTITMRAWGFLPTWADGWRDVEPLINARAETVAMTSFSRPAFQTKRSQVEHDLAATEMVERTMALLATFQVNGH